MLITKTVKVKWDSNNREWYENKGYIFSISGHEFEIRSEDLMNGSGRKVNVQCDNKFCNKESIISYQSYHQNIQNNEDSKYYCNSCSRILGKKHDKNGANITLNEKNERICNVSDCTKPHEYIGYCSRHANQFKKFGMIRERTYRSRNIIEVKDNSAEIILENKNCEEVGRAIIDIEDVDKCRPYSWHLSKNGYVTAFIDDKQIYLHRFIMDLRDSKIQIDHINRCRFDDRKINLRLCTNAENGKNKRVLDANSSGNVGIRYDKRRHYWYASIVINKKSKYLGSSSNKEDVITLREKAEIMYHGEFSPHFNELIAKYPEYYTYIIENNLIYNNTYDTTI